MKVLFVMRHSGYVRNFESTLRMLCDRGHRVELALGSVHAMLDATDVAQQLGDAYPRFSRSVVPERVDTWGLAARELRLALDYLRYLEPEYRDAPKLRARAERNVTPEMLERSRRGLAATRLGRRVLGARARVLHRAVPCDPRIDAFLQARRPDVLVVTPLIQPGAPQAEYVRSARALGIRTALCVASWDNLTNKGVIHGPVDLVTVWNPMMKREAIELHGVPEDRVAVTGAQPFDHWFGWQPSMDREAFCRRVALPADRPYLLYVCSSRFIAPEEVPFVRRWLEQLRASAGLLRDVGVLVRPHPQHADQWDGADLSGLGPVVVWPAGGAVPSDEQGRKDYFDSIHHSAAVVGVNTTAEIESAIIGRRVFSVLAPEFRDTQEGTLHFRHLRDVNGGLLHLAADFPEHLRELEVVVRGEAGGDPRCRRFVEAFVRPFGLGVPATPKVVDALESLAQAPAPAAVRPPFWAPLVQPALARRGEDLQREASVLSEDKALRAARAQAKARKRGADVAAPVEAPGDANTVASPPPPFETLPWQRVADAYQALDATGRVRFGLATAPQIPAEVAVEPIQPERLDYPRADIYLRVWSKTERHALNSCANEPFTITWIEERIQAADVFYDIGANVGVYSLVAARKPGGGARVYAFEPSYVNVASLCANIVINDAGDRVTPLPLALSDRTEVTTCALLALEPGAVRHALGDRPSDEGPALYRQPVLAYRLDDAVAQLGLPLPNHIKLDVDGGEMAVLEGAAATLASPELRSVLVEVSTSLSEDLTRELARRGLMLEMRFDVRNKAGEGMVWYGLFTRAPEGVAAAAAPRVEFVRR